MPLVTETMTRDIEAQKLLDSGLEEHRAGRLEAARSHYRNLLLALPEDPNANYLLGVVTVQLGDGAAGILLLRQAVSMSPSNVEFTHGLVSALKGSGRQREAEAVLRAFLHADPNEGRAHLELAHVLRDRENFEGAERHYRRALELMDSKPVILDALAGLLIASGREDEGESCFRQALALDADRLPSLNNLGLLMASRGNLDEAVELFHRAIKLMPQGADLWFNLAETLHARLSLDEAREAYDQAIALRQDFAIAHLHKGMAWLREGHFRKGWEEYEWRWRAEGFPNTPAPGIPWDGSPLNGADIFLTAEQGLGDILQFVRYAALVSDRGGRVILQVPQSMTRLMKTVPGVARVIPTTQPLGGGPVHAPLMSLPHLFGTTLDTIPANIPYMKVDDEDAAIWRSRIGSDGLKAGVVWRGNIDHRNDANRSGTLSMMAPLADLPGVRLFCLQKDPPVGDRPLPDTMMDLGPKLNDFAQTAAAVSCLDLIISVDTAVAHLAGALGKPVWLLLPHSPDWRWLLDRKDSPWYPSMRLYRQSRRGGWGPVMDQVCMDLTDLVSK